MTVTEHQKHIYVWDLNILWPWKDLNRYDKRAVGARRSERNLSEYPVRIQRYLDTEGQYPVGIWSKFGKIREKGLEKGLIEPFSSR